MVTRTPGFTTRGGQFVVDEESALIAEAMEEIISTIPELALIAPTIQANLRSLCLHTRDLAAYYAKNHPRMSGETTPETTPPMPAKIDRVFWTTRGRVLAEQGPDIPPQPYSFGRGERVPAYPVPWEPGVDYPDPVDIWPLTEMIERELNADPPVEPEDRPCDCSALMNGATDHHPSCGAYRVQPNNVPVINPADWVEMPFKPLPVEEDEPKVDYI